MSPIRRITLFKIPSESDISAVLSAYDVLMATNLKVRHHTSLPAFSLLKKITHLPGLKTLHPNMRRLARLQHLRGTLGRVHGGGAEHVCEQGGCGLLR